MFKGRISRSVYFAMLTVFLAVIFAINYFATKPISALEASLILLTIPRLHDIGRSGWLVLWGVAIEVVGLIASFVLLPQESVQVGMGLTVLVLGVVILILGLIPGDKGANKYGEQPFSLWRGTKQKADLSQFD